MEDRPIITRAEAKARGLKRYFTGEPCKHGHIAERYVADGRCMVCSAERVAARYRLDPEKGREDQKRRRAEKPDQYRAMDRKYYAKTIDARRESQKRYRTANEALCRERAAAWRAENKELARARCSAWRKKNLSRRAAYEAARRAAQARATPAWANTDAILAFYAACPPGFEVDHIVPIKGKNVCGLHCEANLQYLSRSDNARKINKHDPDEHDHVVPIWLDDWEWCYG